MTALQSEFPNLRSSFFFVDRLRYLYGLGFSDFIAPILDPTPTEYDVHVYQSSSKTWNIPLVAKLYSKMHHDTGMDVGEFVLLR